MYTGEGSRGSDGKIDVIAAAILADGEVHSGSISDCPTDGSELTHMPSSRKRGAIAVTPHELDFWFGCVHAGAKAVTVTTENGDGLIGAIPWEHGHKPLLYVIKLGEGAEEPGKPPVPSRRYHVTRRTRSSTNTGATTSASRLHGC